MNFPLIVVSDTGRVRPGPSPFKFSGLLEQGSVEQVNVTRVPVADSGW